ncbi:MAG: DUF362 domain-containing protein [Chloroflexi bacterium]|nr:DUF362 domain-containing protein [Chloroflexota bacterium]MCL5074848.1 DUF362 domain-containing protein [Chloroflexota bacterium]
MSRGATRTSRVALVKGDDRYRNALNALQLISDDIDLSHKKSIFIKPNFLSTTVQLAATHVDAVRAVLDFVRARYAGPITIGEGTGAPAYEGFQNFGYLDLSRQYGVELVDLNEDEGVEVQVYDRRWQPLRLRVAKRVVESDYRISVCPPKTHDVVVVTLSLKNMIMGSLLHRLPVGSLAVIRNLLRQTYRYVPPFVKYSPLLEGLKSVIVNNVSRSDRVAMHQGYAVHNLNLYLLARIFPPHLSIIDGFTGMEGDGPGVGEAVDLCVAVASTDFLAADTVAAKMMGFDIDQIGYLHYCRLAGLGVGDLERIEILGDSLERVARRFRPHPTYQHQLKWHFPAHSAFGEIAKEVGLEVHYGMGKDATL